MPNYTNYKDNDNKDDVPNLMWLALEANWDNKRNRQNKVNLSLHQNI